MNERLRYGLRFAALAVPFVVFWVTCFLVSPVLLDWLSLKHEGYAGKLAAATYLFTLYLLMIGSGIGLVIATGGHRNRTAQQKDRISN